MVAITSRALRGFAVVFMLALAGASHAAGDVREILWDDLMPPNWNPYAQLEELRARGGGSLVDGTPEANALLREFVQAGRNAPTVTELNGQTVKLPGFVVPLDFEGTKVKEFLLVPYYGACIHVPPPPSNQIVYVKTEDAYRLGGMFDAVWVTGTLKTQAHLNDIGDAGYTLEASAIKPYE